MEEKEETEKVASSGRRRRNARPIPEGLKIKKPQPHRCNEKLDQVLDSLNVLDLKEAARKFKPFWKCMREGKGKPKQPKSAENKIVDQQKE